MPAYRSKKEPALRRVRRVFGRIRKRVTLHRIGVVVSALLIAAFAVLFFRIFVSSYRKPANVSCTFLNQKEPFSYIQYNVKEQAAEPFFRGTMFINLGDVLTGPASADVVTTGGLNYASTTTRVDFFRDEPNKTFWMRKESGEFPLVRQSGAPRDFPFDSTSIEFDTTITPPVHVSGIIVRNFNPSFYLPCDQVRFSSAANVLHLRFEMRRNSLVQLMALVILGAASLFTVIIPFAVKKDVLPTAVASFFFSVWSTRGILSSEMKAFPTFFDMWILVLCILLILLIAVRGLIGWIRATWNPPQTEG